MSFSPPPPPRPSARTLLAPFLLRLLSSRFLSLRLTFPLSHTRATNCGATLTLSTQQFQRWRRVRKSKWLQRVFFLFCSCLRLSFPLCSIRVQSQKSTWCSGSWVEPHIRNSVWPHMKGTSSNLLFGVKQEDTYAVIWPCDVGSGIMCYYISEETNIFDTGINIITCLREQGYVSSEFRISCFQTEYLISFTCHTSNSGIKQQSAMICPVWVEMNVDFLCNGHYCSNQRLRWDTMAALQKWFCESLRKDSEFISRIESVLF